MAEVFQLGQEASASAFEAALKTIHDQGTSILDTIETARVDALVSFDRRLQAINARRIRAWRVKSSQQAVKFVVSDFSDLDQANTTTTVRIDSSSVSLRERAVPAEAVIKTNHFSVNKGTIEALDSAQTILRVHTDDFSTPTGQFDIELVTPLTLNQFIIDIVATPSSPTIVVSVSSDGLTYTQASKVAINGYRINVWLTSTEVRYIRMQVTPSHPDTLNGNTFTFGITDFSAQATEYHLRSDLLTKVIQFVPKSIGITLDAVEDPNIQYYLSIWADGETQPPFVEVAPGDIITIGTAVSNTVSTTASNPTLLAVTPLGLYVNSVVVTERGTALRIAQGLSSDDPRIQDIINEYVAIDQASSSYDISLLRGDGDYNAPRTFVVSYIYGPQLVNVQMKVRLSTSDPATSPIFHGASLDEV